MLQHLTQAWLQNTQDDDSLHQCETLIDYNNSSQHPEKDMVAVDFFYLSENKITVSAVRRVISKKKT